MEPPSFDGGNYIVRRYLHGAQLSFNGAAVFRRRKREPAENQPGSFSVLLQWSRRLSTAETGHTELLSVQERLEASMEPPSFDGGNPDGDEDSATSTC